MNMSDRAEIIVELKAQRDFLEERLRGSFGNLTNGRAVVAHLCGEIARLQTMITEIISGEE